MNNAIIFDFRCSAKMMGHMRCSTLESVNLMASFGANNSCRGTVLTAHHNLRGIGLSEFRMNSENGPSQPKDRVSL
jgi:hypothetical protein